ncbi:MAG: GAF domain-containing protein [Candidatus Bathyarchaeota archaeon]
MERNGWKSFTNYESDVNSTLTGHRIIALCTYSLERCTARDIVDVIKNHVGTLIRRDGEWCLVEDSSERRRMEEEIKSIAKFPSDNPYPVLRIGKDGTVLYSNPACGELLDEEKCSVGQLIPQNWRKLVLEVLHLGVPKQVNETHGDKTFSYTFEPIVDSGYVNIYGIDTTERNRLEQDLRETLQESRQHEAEISALLKASAGILQNRDFQFSARAIFDACKNLLGASAGYVALLRKDRKENEVLFLDSGGLPCSADPSLPMPIRGLRAETYALGKVVVENNFPQSQWLKLMPQGHVLLNNVLFTPLIVNQKTVGVIGLANKPGGFNERDAQMALAFGEIASISLTNSQNLQKLEENDMLLKVHSEHLEELVEERSRQLRDS